MSNAFLIGLRTALVELDGFDGSLYVEDRHLVLQASGLDSFGEHGDQVLDHCAWSSKRPEHEVRQERRKEHEVGGSSGLSGKGYRLVERRRGEGDGAATGAIAKEYLYLLLGMTCTRPRVTAIQVQACMTRRTGARREAMSVGARDGGPPRSGIGMILSPPDSSGAAGTRPRVMCHSRNLVSRARTRRLDGSTTPSMQSFTTQT